MSIRERERGGGEGRGEGRREGGREGGTEGGTEGRREGEIRREGEMERERDDCELHGISYVETENSIISICVTCFSFVFLSFQLDQTALWKITMGELIAGLTSTSPYLLPQPFPFPLEPASGHKSPSRGRRTHDVVNPTVSQGKSTKRQNIQVSFTCTFKHNFIPIRIQLFSGQTVSVSTYE